MPERGFDTGFWSDDFVMGLTHPAKLLFHYLGSNDHCNQAGVYHIAPKTIAFETGLPESDLPSLLKMLQPEVKWLPEENIVWVKNFIAHQTKSPKFLVAAAKCLTKIRNNGLVGEVLEYNRACYTLSIPYPYHTDMVLIPPVSVSVSVTGTDTDSSKEDEVKGKGELTEVAPKGAGDSHRAEGDGATISTWRSVKGWSLTPDEELHLVASLGTEFPDIDVLEQSKVWAARKLSEPLKRDSKPSQQIWNFMRLERKFAAQRKNNEVSKYSKGGQHGTGYRPPKPEGASKPGKVIDAESGEVRTTG